MRKDKKKEMTYSFFYNVCFVIKEQWKFEKKSILIPIIRIPSDIIVTMVGVLLPKVVLDSLKKQLTPEQFVVRIGSITILLMILKYISYYTEIGVNKSANKIRQLYYKKNVDFKKVDMDYGIFASPNGKTKIEKATAAIGNGINNSLCAFYPSLIELLKNSLGFISYCAIIAVLNPLIILLLLISFVVNAFFTLKIEKWLHKTKDERSLIERKIGYVAFHTRDSAISKDIRLYSMTGWLKELSNIFMKERVSWEKRIAFKQFQRLLLEGGLLFIRNGAVYAYLIYLMINTHMTIGNFTLYFGVITGFGDWLSQMVLMSEKLSVANHQLVDYRELIDLQDKMNRGIGTPIMSAEEPVSIKFENVSFKYEGSDRTILDNINLEVAKGEKLAIVGVNGAGKTTLIKLICGLLSPVSGRILINGADIKAFNRDEYYTLISAVFQNISTIPTSVAKNIALCSEDKIDRQKVWKCLKLANIDSRIKKLPKGIDTNLMKHIADDGVELSGGEMQRLILARALYKNSSIIILDEPTAALDPIAEKEMYIKYNELTANKTSIYISHRLSSTKFCDRIILLDGAKLAEIGTHDELMAKHGKYAEMFEVQSHYYKDRNLVEVMC